MKRIFVLIFILQIVHCKIISQTLCDSILERKVELIGDSIDKYYYRGDYHKVLSICENGLTLLSNNNKYGSRAECVLSLCAGNTCVNLNEYYDAKFYYFKSFIINELGKFDIGVYNEVEKVAEEDTNLVFFKQLLDFIKSDSINLEILASNPNDLAEILNSAALKQFDKGDFSTALELFEMEINLLDVLGQTGSELYLSIISIEISCLLSMNNFDLAQSHADYNLNLVEICKGRNTIDYANALATKANVEENCGNAEAAIKLYNESLSLIEHINGKDNFDYIHNLRCLGNIYQISNFKKSLEIELEAEELLAIATDATIEEKVCNFGMLSTLYHRGGNNQKSLNYAEKAIAILEANELTESWWYRNALNTQLKALLANKHYDNAIKTAEKAINIYAQIDKNHNDEISYRQLIGDLSFIYFELGDYDKAISIMQPLLSEDFPDDEYKLTHLLQITNYYRRAGLMDLLKETCEASMSLALKIGGNKSDAYAQSLLFSSQIQEKDGDKIVMLQEAANIFKELYGENNEYYISALKAISLFEFETENKNISIESQDKILSSYQNVYVEEGRQYLNERIDYLRQRGKEALYNRDLTNLNKTIVQLDSLSQNIKASFSEADDLYFNAKNNLAEMMIDCYKISGDTSFYNKALDVQNSVLSTALSLFGRENIKYIEKVELLVKTKGSICSTYYFHNRDEYEKISNLWCENNEIAALDFYNTTFISQCYSEIYELQSSIIDYYINSNNIKCHKYARACQDLAKYYYMEISTFPSVIYKHEDIIKQNKEKGKKAEQLLLTALKIYEDLEDCTWAIDVLRDLYFLHEYFDDTKKSANVLFDSFKLWKNETIKQISLMTYEEKSLLIYKSKWIFDLYSSAVKHIDSDKNMLKGQYTELLYNTQLFSKGLLLESEIGLRELVKSSGNQELIVKLNRFEEVKKLLSDESDVSNYKILYNEKSELERQLMKESEHYGNYLTNLNYTFDNVRASLRETDVAIEFASTVNFDPSILGERRYYFALILKQDYTSPKIIILDSPNVNIGSMYEIIWKPLWEEIKDAKNIYFSPTHELNFLPIEYTQMPDGRYFSDLGINLYRVSSTREIIKNAVNNKEREYNALLYGGLIYDLKPEQLIAESRSGEFHTENAHRAVDLSNLRYGVKYLPGTKKEVEDIYKQFKVSTKATCDTIIGIGGTEESFKALAGKNVGIIHLATHGFYWTEEVAEHRDYVSFLSKENYKTQTFENITLLRSGLLFSGANIGLTGEELPDDVEDGVLTAKELSAMNLGGVDMVVMSACQSGLGETLGEGIYGLPRGFKRAGANSILMSLWKVDDDATQKLMTEFYENYLSGKSKRESLLNAQKVVRETPGFEDPEYWAGFILLDGLD